MNIKEDEIICIKKDGVYSMATPKENIPFEVIEKIIIDFKKQCKRSTYAQYNYRIVTSISINQSDRII